MKSWILYVYRFKNNAKRQTMFGRTCAILGRFRRMNSVWIEFTDNGQQEIVSGNAIRKVH